VESIPEVTHRRGRHRLTLEGTNEEGVLSQA
jgi:hypothetical protein